MIEFYDGEKATPKTKAREIILDAMQTTLCALYENNCHMARLYSLLKPLNREHTDMSKYTCYYCLTDHNDDEVELVEISGGEKVVACTECRGQA